MASSTSTSIEELLSRAKMISVKLGLQDISDWLEYELNGYPSADILPDYRILKDIPIKAWNPYRGWIPCEVGNFANSKTQDIYDELTTVSISQPVSMLTELAKSEETLHADLPSYLATLLKAMTNTNFQIKWFIPSTQMTKILSNTRSKILDWALLLEQKNILGEGLQFSNEEKKGAAEMTINNINFHGNVNNAGTIGAGNTGDISQQNRIIAGDFSSLEHQLKEYGIQDKDIAELKLAVDGSPAPTSSANLGHKVGGWLGNMIGSAYSGSLKIAGSVAPTLLTNALCHYYNIPA